MIALFSIVVGLVIAAIIVLPFIVFFAWILMLLLGVLASLLTVPVLAIGFAPCFVICLICGLLF